MLIAKIENQQVTEVADYREMFPEVSFPASGPDTEFMQANSCLSVTVWKPHDHSSEKLQQSDPYIENGQVFTVTVVPLTEEEIASINLSKSSKNSAKAKELLKQTDWVEVSSVSDSTLPVYLTNVDEFIEYRNTLRSIAVNPTPTVDWPDMPKEVWSIA